MRTWAAVLVLLVMLTLPALASTPVIHSRFVRLHHAAVGTAMHLLHWDDINGLPTGVISVTADAQHHALKVEGTEDGIAAAVQAIGFVDIAPHHVRINVRLAYLRGPAPVAAGRKTPTADAVVAFAYRTVALPASTVENNAPINVPIRIVRPVSGAQYVDSGIHISPRVNDSDTVTLNGTASLDALLPNLDLDAASPESIGMVELIRTVPSGKSVVLGAFRVRPTGKIAANPVYLYILITPHVS